MKLSDLHPDDVQIESQASTGGLKLSDLNPNDVNIEAPTKPTSVGQAVTQQVKELPNQTMQALKDFGTEARETSQDFLTGAGQGVTMGFGDELYGAIQAGRENDLTTMVNALRGDSAARDALSKSYRKNQEAAQSAVDEANERSPWATGIGDVGASLATGLLTAGAGLGANAGRIGLRELAKKAGLGAALKEGGKRVGIEAAKMAPLGALAGAGYSKEGHLIGATPLEQQKLGADALGGASFGALAGGALKGTTEVGEASLSKGKEVFNKGVQKLAESDSPYIRQIAKSYQKGVAGENLYSKTGKVAEGIGEQQTRDINDITSKFINTEDKIGSKITQSIDNATDDGVVINAAPDLAEASSYIQRVIANDPEVIGQKEFQSLSKELYDLQSNNLTPRAAYNLRKRIADLSDKMQDPKIKMVADRFQAGLKSSLDEQVPGFKQSMAEFHDFRRAGSETILAKGQDANVANVWAGDLKNQDLAVSKEVTNLLGKLTNPTALNDAELRTMSNLMKNLKSFEAQHPGRLQELGFPSIEALKSEITNKADQFSLTKRAFNQSLGSHDIKTGLLGQGVVRGPNLLGHGVNKISDISRKMYSLPDKALQPLANELKNVPGLNHIGGALEKGLNEKNAALKNAAIFQLLQRPDGRAFIDSSSISGVEDEQ